MSEELYQYKPFYGSSHSWAQKVLSKISSNSAVLDIGAGSGFAGSYLLSRGTNDIYAIEINEESAIKLQKIYKSVVKDISDFNDKKFDVVILMDILEHLANPSSYLENLKKYLNDDATIIISVPNIAHWSVRIPLLFGRFTYRDRGILDKTHLHFFTRYSLKQFLANTGFELQELNETIVPLELILPKFLQSNVLFKAFSRVRKYTAKIFPGLCAYQLLAHLTYKK